MLRRTFVIAILLIGGGLIINGTLDLFFRYIESADTIGTLQRGKAKGGALKLGLVPSTLRSRMKKHNITKSG